MPSNQQLRGLLYALNCFKSVNFGPICGAVAFYGVTTILLAYANAVGTLGWVRYYAPFYLNIGCMS
eukprot:scaffold18751_cov21-Prasinocladus_malaysianus.AAC.1